MTEITQETKDTIEKIKTEFPIKVWKPNSEHSNINSDGEWVLTKWPFAYGIEVNKRDHKCRISYNIDPNQLTPETYVEAELTDIPYEVYKMLLIKVDRDIERLKQMLENLEKNTEFIIGYKFLIIDMLNSWNLSPAEYEVLEFTPEDEVKEKQAEVERYKMMTKQQENKKVLDRKKAKRQKKK
jgi:hypothetical protein